MEIMGFVDFYCNTRIHSSTKYLPYNQTNSENPDLMAIIKPATIIAEEFVTVIKSITNIAKE